MLQQKLLLELNFLVINDADTRRNKLQVIYTVYIFLYLFKEQALLNEYK